MHPSAARLFQVDADLRTEADQVLTASGIGAILAASGHIPVGSHTMRTMIRRDLDFELAVGEPDWDAHWDLATRIAGTGWCTRVQCVNVYREQWADFGLYLGVHVAVPDRPEPIPRDDPSIWNLDIWTARPDEFERGIGPRRRWAELMTDEARSHILAIKEALRDEGRYGKPVLSVHVYEGVLERGIRHMAAFDAWWEATHGCGSQDAP